ncbi:sugar ABC transporter substrate-binding protein [Acidisoma cellulosilytica]|uniref:Sugar ABC transporter substrate-binding protein n=1 Tax=Acidisoma cellulosilyticum TaxID=2802395 RepID=A0A963Z0B9_9PROT|nr:sugar ABC transporter substrate-binding protein [Acidisoma cellulosilyticum]MCB8880369.1 sugar ABC transporter substrate-binding protein [Acidisoma cellulosilyticum]
MSEEQDRPAVASTETAAPSTAALRRRGLLTGATAGAAATMLAGLATQARAAESAFPDHPRWKFVFVNHVTTNPFFVPTQYGIADACKLLGCSYQWTGSETSDAGQMVNSFNAAIAAKVDAIATCLVDPKAFNSPTERALAAGIPVFAYNADVPAGSNNGRLAYIGQDLYKAGYGMGEHIVNLVDSGKVALFIATPGQLNIQPRFDGAKDAIAKSGKSITVDEIATGPTLNEEIGKVQAYYLGHQDVKGMFAVDGGSTQGVAMAMKMYNLPKKGVHGGGFDLLPKTLEIISEGFCDFTIDQQPYLQGFYTVLEMFLFKASGGLVGPADINTGLKFVTKETVGPYLATKTRYEGNSGAPQIVPSHGPIG